MKRVGGKGTVRLRKTRYIIKTVEECDRIRGYMWTVECALYVYVPRVCV